ncbi:MAG: hypothetical protein JOZ07_17990 [Solirubrobacterales bacterium]|nr:hypothetical protein [Solirubrobacterales bacterium]
MKLFENGLTAPSLGGLLTTRRGSAILAVLCAVCAGGILLFAMSRYRASVQQPTPQATVLVAMREIPKGTPGNRIAQLNLYRSTPVVAAQLSAGAISDAGQLAGATASTNIVPGQQLTSADFSAQSGVDTTLAPDQRAVEVTISESPGATDVTEAGDHVDIYRAAGSGNARSGQAPIATDVKVIKPASPTPVRVGNRVVTGSSMVLALGTGQVGPVIENANGLYLALRPSETDPATG